MTEFELPHCIPGNPLCTANFEDTCNNGDEDFDNDPHGEGRQASCDGCAFRGEPVNLLTRQAYVRPRPAARIDIPLSGDHSLEFEIGWDSIVARKDHDDDVSGASGAQLPHARTLGLGVRSNWDQRLILNDQNYPSVVTWLGGSEHVTFSRAGMCKTDGDCPAEETCQLNSTYSESAEGVYYTGYCTGDYCADQSDCSAGYQCIGSVCGGQFNYVPQPGKNVQLFKATPSGSEWVVVTENGDRFIFERPGAPGTFLHPRREREHHYRLREVRPRSLAGYRFRLFYEGSLDVPAGICEEITPGKTCSTVRGLLAAVVAQMVDPNGVITTLPSMEFKYRFGDNTMRDEVLLDRILAGAYRAENLTTGQLPVLARFNYSAPASGANLSARLVSVVDHRTIPSFMAAKFAYSWVSSPRWQLERVSEPVIDQDGVQGFATVESFTWANGQVASHISDRTTLVAGSSTGSWVRNGAPESFTFTNTGDAVSCADQVCGVGNRQFVDSNRNPSRSMTRKVQNEDGTATFYFYDELDRVAVTSVMVGSATCSAPFPFTGTTMTCTATPRRAVRTYYLGSSGVVKATAEWMNDNGTTVTFPQAGSTGVNWFAGGTSTLPLCPVLTTAVGSDFYKVTSIDYDSDGDGIFNEPLDPADPYSGDFAVTRVTTLGVNNGLDRAGTCQKLGIDRYGRRDRNAREERFHLTGTGTWELVERVYRTYKTFATIPRHAGMPISFGFDKTPASPSAATTILSFRECPTGPSNTDFLDEEGRLTCFEVPHGSDFLRVRETTSLSPEGLRRRTYTFTNQDGTVVWGFHRDETAGGRVHEESPLNGNKIRFRYNRTVPAAAAALAKTIEVLYDGSVRATTSYAYDSFGRRISETASGVGLTTTQRVYEDYDKDNRPARIKDGTSAPLSTTALLYNTFDKPTAITEPDGQGQRNVYSSGLFRYIDRRASGDITYANDAQIRSYDRWGRISSVSSGAMTTMGLTRDGLGRPIRHQASSVGIETAFLFDDQNRIRTTSTKALDASTSRIERRLYDGLGRLLEVCDKSSSNLIPACASSEVQNTFVYESHGPFAATECQKTDYSPAYTMTGRYLQGRLGYATDSDGGTAYEYDALGRVMVVMRHEGPISTFNANNLVCTRYEYTSDGSIRQVTNPSGRRVRYNYGGDAVRPVQILADVNPATLLAPIATDITYDTDGSVKSFKWFGSSVARREVIRDSQMRVTEISDYRPNGTKILKAAYGYDLEGDLTSEFDGPAPTMLSTNTTQSDITRTYSKNSRRDYFGGMNGSATTYDNEGRTTYQGALAVTFDASFRERVLTDQGGIFSYGYGTIPPYSPLPLGQIRTITVAGTTRTLHHGLRGELKMHVNSTGTWTYHYDHEMRRVRKADPTSSQHWRFRYGLGRDPIADYTKYLSNGSWGSSEWITLNGQQIAAVYSSSTNTGTLHAVHTDRMGVPRKVSTVAGTVVATLPMQTNGAGSTVIIGPGRSLNHRYAGQMYDEESGLINNGYRSLWNGRYTSPDPLHLQSQLRFIGAQAYNYAAHRPQVNQDPDGRYAGALVITPVMVATGAALAISLYVATVCRTDPSKCRAPDITVPLPELRPRSNQKEQCSPSPASPENITEICRLLDTWLDERVNLRVCQYFCAHSGEVFEKDVSPEQTCPQAAVYRP